MKKTLSMLLALVMCLSLCACGGGNDAPKGDETSKPEDTTANIAEPEETTTGETEPTSTEILLEVGQTVSINDTYDITITNLTFTDKAKTPGTDYSISASNGEVCVNVYYNLKYNGKANMYFSGLPVVLNYGDGYVFVCTRTSWYSSAVDAYLNSGDVKVLTPEFECIAHIFVPEEVQTNQQNPLSISFCENAAKFDVRPSDDAAKETRYQYCLNQLQSEDWNTVSAARNFMIELGDYKNSEITARLQCFTYDDRNFFKGYVAELTAMTEDEVAALLSDNTFHAKNNVAAPEEGYHTISFYANGLADAKYWAKDQEWSMFEEWRLEDGYVILTHQNTDGKIVERIMTPYQYNETQYLLIDMNGDNSILLALAQ